jgi:hypothetical protein
MRLCFVTMSAAVFILWRACRSRRVRIFLSEDFLEKCSRPQQHHHIRVCANQTRSIATRVAVDSSRQCGKRKSTKRRRRSGRNESDVCGAHSSLLLMHIHHVSYRVCAPCKPFHASTVGRRAKFCCNDETVARVHSTSYYR